MYCITLMKKGFNRLMFCTMSFESENTPNKTVNRKKQ